MKLNSKGTATTKNEKVILYALGILSILALCYLFIISPAANKNKPITDEIAVKEKEIKELQNIDFDIENKQGQLDKLKVKYKEATDGLPASDRYPQIFKDVEQMAVDSGLTSVGGTFYKPESVKTVNKNGAEVTADNKNQFDGMKYLQVDYYFENDIDKTLVFIDKLENYDRIADIGQIKQEEEGMVVKVYFYSAGGNEKEEYDFN